MIEVTASSAVSGVDPEPLAARVRAVFAAEGRDRASAGLMVVGAEEMAELNHRHRGKEGPTDVLSFPIDGVDPERATGDGPPPELGDVVICPDAAQVPLTTLAIHGALHLLGYDHESDDGLMLRRQDELVEALS
jgi:probable rRNA maturation factor